MLIDGVPACPRCGRRPRKAIPEGTKSYAQGRRWYGYCAVCRPDAERERRQESMRVSPDERRLLLELRDVRPAGRHHARLQATPFVMNAFLWIAPWFVPLLLARPR